MLKKRWKNGIIFLLILGLLLPSVVWAEETLLDSGDQIILTAVSADKAVSSALDTLGVIGLDYAGEDTDPQAVWTAICQEDGSWILENEAGRLSMDEAYYLTLNGCFDSWQIADLGDGRITVANTQAGWFLTWYPALEVFDVSQEKTEFSELRLFVLPEETTETTTETTEETTTETSVEITTETTTETTTQSTEDSNTETTETSTSQPTDGPVSPDMGPWNYYFGQLHAHTADSDGQGTVAEAFAQASQVLDFFAVTDHSDSFDNDEAGDLLTDGGTLSQVWAAGKAAAQAATAPNFVAIYGFELSWNQGQGHISTLNTPGWISRDQEEYQLYQNGMEAYFQTLLTAPNSVSQFNHPGDIYGDFKAFSAYDPKLDSLITLMEVGSGTGSEYRTCLDRYVQALDKGWHLAPTNNQNNHNGDFGIADGHRTVVLTTELTEQNLYEAMKSRRVYATEDADLQIYYTLDGAIMGSEVPVSRVGERAELLVKLHDPTDTDLGTVEVITSGGAVAASAQASGTVSFSLPADADYYFLRITQGDGDVAVTAPVWIRQADDMGIASIQTANALTRAGEEQTVEVTIFNNEADDLTDISLELRDEEGNLLGEIQGETLAGYATKTYSFDYTFPVDGLRTVTALVQATFQGEAKQWTESLDILVLPVALTSDILVDGTHGQTGEYAEFLTLAAEQNISARVESAKITEEQLASCRLLVIPAPEQPFEPEFLEAVKSYVNSGGKLILMAKAGGSEEMNHLLEVLASELRFQPDTVLDETSNGGASDEIFTAQIAPSEYTQDVTEGQIFAYISGCSVAGGTWLIQSREATVLAACEEGIFAFGSDFLRDAYLRTDENPWALPYANRTIAETLLGITRTAPTIAPIDQVRQGEVGRVYLVSGLVTAGTHNVNTTFPDRIYIQDASGAMEVQGYVDPELELGSSVLICGVLAMEADRPILQLQSMEITGSQTPVQPERVDTLPDYAKKGDQLLAIRGKVTRVETENDAVRSFVLEDETGKEAVIWVEEYILSGSLGRNHLDTIVKEGNIVSAVGFCHLREGKTVLRIRDCDEVTLLWEIPEPTTEPTTEVTTEATTEATTEPTTEATTEATTEPTTEETTVATTEAITEVTTESTTEVTTEAATEVTTEATTEATTEITTQVTTEATIAATTEPITQATTETTQQTTVPPTTKPPAWPDNPPTGDGVFPGRLLGLMSLCCLLMGMLVWKKE